MRNDDGAEGFSWDTVVKHFLTVSEGGTENPTIVEIVSLKCDFDLFPANRCVLALPDP